MTQRFAANFYQPNTLLVQACDQATSDGKLMADQLHQLANRMDGPMSAADRRLLHAAIQVIERLNSVNGLLLARSNEDGPGT